MNNINNCVLTFIIPGQEAHLVYPLNLEIQQYPPMVYTLLIRNNTFYYGDSLNEQPFGLGYLNSPEGIICIGNWKEGCLEGIGICQYPDMSVYKGEWKGGHKEGLGIMRFANGKTISGEWKNDKINGWGIIRDPDGNIIYFGKWKDNLMHGEGIFFSQNRPQHEHVFKEGKEIIRRSLLMCNEVIDFPDEQINFLVSNLTQDESIYVGEWQNERPHGLGALIFPDGRICVGNWMEGCLEGKGIYHYLDGSDYSGEWKGGRREGPGTMRFADGKTCSGDWKHDNLKDLATIRDPIGNLICVRNCEDILWNDKENLSSSPHQKHDGDEEKAAFGQSLQIGWKLKVRKWSVVDASSQNWYQGTIRARSASGQGFC